MAMPLLEIFLDRLILIYHDVRRRLAGFLIGYFNISNSIQSFDCVKVSLIDALSTLIQLLDVNEFYH